MALCTEGCVEGIFTPNERIAVQGDIWLVSHFGMDVAAELKCVRSEEDRMS